MLFKPGWQDNIPLVVLATLAVLFCLRSSTDPEQRQVRIVLGVINLLLLGYYAWWRSRQRPPTP